MKGTEAFQELLPLIKDDEPVVHANGFICRESFALKDREANFYMIGSMGLASSIGLGVSICKPEKKVIIIDGVRSTAEIEVLKNVGSVKLLSIEATAGTRYKFLSSRGRSDDPATREKFEERDNRELGVGIGESIAIADETISNSNITLDELTELAYKVIEKWTDT